MGARDDDFDGMVDAGSAYIFERNESSGIWYESVKLIAKEPFAFDYVGHSVSIHKDVALVGTSNTYGDSGTFYIYQKIEIGRWQQTGTIKEENRLNTSATFQDRFGQDCNVWDDNAITGAYGINNYSGRAYIIDGVKLEPTVAPTAVPTSFPTYGPTNKHCDITVQTYDTYYVCEFLMLFLNQSYEYFALNYENYCHFDDYFSCQFGNNNYNITGMSLDNLDLVSELTNEMMDFLYKLNNTLESINLSGNNITGTVDDWSKLNYIKRLNLSSNSQLGGGVDFDSLANIEILDLSNCQFWGVVDINPLINLIYFDISNNLFTEIQGLDILSSIAPDLEEFYINNNNQLDGSLSLAQLPDSLKNLKCGNNSLTGDIIIRDMPQNLIAFDCSNNDFGRFEWELRSATYEKYSLEYLILSHTKLIGNLDMIVFDSDGEYNNLKRIELNENAYLNVTIDFEYLTSTDVEYLNLLGTNTHGRVDFSYLTNDIVIKLDTSVYCVTSFCQGKSNGKIVSYIRHNDTCVGSNGCSDSCNCVTPYEAGLQSYVNYGYVDAFVNVLLCIIGTFTLIAICGNLYRKGVFGSNQIWKCKKYDEFSITSCFSFIFQFWDFFSDIALFYDMYDRYDQESFDSPDKNRYLAFAMISATFIIIPWTVNLIFLLKSKQSWEREMKRKRKMVSDSIEVNSKEASLSPKNFSNFELHDNDALSQADYHCKKWLAKYASMLVILCMISGGLTPALRVVNSKLFGLEWFDMGLPRYKQQETTKYRLWLTVIIENIPQIVISTCYATLLTAFNETVLFALVSSILSAVLAICQAYLEFPKHYYIYQLKVLLNLTNSSSITARKSLRKTNRIGLIMCDVLDQDSGYCFVENAFFNGNSFVLNVVCNERIHCRMHDGRRGKLMNELFTHFKIISSDIEWQYISHKRIKLLSWKQALFCQCFSKRARSQADVEDMREMSSISAMNTIRSTQSMHSMNSMHGIHEMHSLHGIHNTHTSPHEPEIVLASPSNPIQIRPTTFTSASTGNENSIHDTFTLNHDLNNVIVTTDGAGSRAETPHGLHAPHLQDLHDVSSRVSPRDSPRTSQAHTQTQARLVNGSQMPQLPQLQSSQQSQKSKTLVRHSQPLPGELIQQLAASNWSTQEETKQANFPNVMSAPSKNKSMKNTSPSYMHMELQKWTSKHVSKWMETSLREKMMKNDDSEELSNGINKFITHFNQHFINGKLLKKLSKEAIFADFTMFRSVFETNSYAIWINVKEIIEELTNYHD